MEATKLAGFLGLCARARQLTFGQEACVTLIRGGKAALALMDESSSDNTRKRLRDACASHGTALYALPADLLARATGQDGRKVAAVGRGGMADKLKALLATETPVDSPMITTTNHDANHAGVQANQ